jgi:hypothetical protein
VKHSIYCKSTIYFRRHNNIMVYLLNFSITYINYFGYMFRLLWVIFRPWFQELLYILFYSFLSYSFVLAHHNRRRVQPEDLPTRVNPHPQILTIENSYQPNSPQYHIDISSGFVMHKGIPSAIVRLRQKL